jgi:hypothetical protein
MSLYEKITTLYPSLTDADFMPTRYNHATERQRWSW